MTLRKTLALTLAVVMSLMFTACTKETAEEESTQIANPVHDCTFDEMLSTTNIDISAPDGAEDIVYSYIDGTEESAAVAQVVFTLDGTEFCYRAQMTDVTSLGGSDSEEVVDPQAEADAMIELTTPLSGMYEEWSAAVGYMVSDRDAIIALNEGKSGYIAWLDVVPGVMYSLSVNNGATQDLLANTAEAIFVPLQGEV